MYLKLTETKTEQCKASVFLNRNGWTDPVFLR